MPLVLFQVAVLGFGRLVYFAEDYYFLRFLWILQEDQLALLLQDQPAGMILLSTSLQGEFLLGEFQSHYLFLRVLRAGDFLSRGYAAINLAGLPVGKSG